MAITERATDHRHEARLEPSHRRPTRSWSGDHRQRGLPGQQLPQHLGDPRRPAREAPDGTHPMCWNRCVTGLKALVDEHGPAVQDLLRNAQAPRDGSG